MYVCSGMIGFWLYEIVKFRRQMNVGERKFSISFHELGCLKAAVLGHFHCIGEICCDDETHSLFTKNCTTCTSSYIS